jgi:hypothetical protein
MNKRVNESSGRSLRPEERVHQLREYQSPALRAWGNIRDLTHGSLTGNQDGLGEGGTEPVFFENLPKQGPGPSTSPMGAPPGMMGP